ncbi:MAG: hypothetical protein ACFFCS_11725 [Candidatus Hodarchaeota archaeon]
MEKLKKIAIFKMFSWIIIFTICLSVIAVLKTENKALLISLSTIMGASMAIVSYREYKNHVVHVNEQVKSLKQIRQKSTQMQKTLVDPTKEENEQKDEEWVPERELSIFSTEILQKLDDLKVDEDIEDEILEMLKEIPPEKRVQYINDIFNENFVFETNY